MHLITMAHVLLTAAMTVLLAVSCPVSASPIPLQSDITWHWLKPNLGANLNDLTSEGDYVEYGGQRLDSFLFFGTKGNSAPLQSDLWLVFSEPSSILPMVVFYGLDDPTRRLETLEKMEFGVSWRVTNLDGTALSSATVSVASVSAGLNGNLGSASIEQSVFGEDGALLGEHNALLVAPGFGSRVENTLFFNPQRSLHLSSLVRLDNAGFFAFGAATGDAGEVPEPGLVSLVCASLVGAVLAHSRRKKKIVAVSNS
jgi:hypothetical protein